MQKEEIQKMIEIYFSDQAMRIHAGIMESVRKEAKSGLLHSTAPETDARLKQIEKSNENVKRFFYGSIIFILSTLVYTGYWTATISAKIDNLGYEIARINSSGLVQQDAKIFDTKLDALSHRIDDLSNLIQKK